MKPSLDRPCFSRRTQRIALWITIGFPIYLLSVGPVIRLIDDGHLPEETAYLYVPLYPLGYIPGSRAIFNWYIFHVWKVDNAGDITL